MKAFCIKNVSNINALVSDSNGWSYGKRVLGRIAFSFLRSPIMKEVYYSKGGGVRNVRKSIYCIGLLSKEKAEYCGVAFFELPVRPLIILAVLLGASWVASNFGFGITAAVIAYLIISFLSYDNDSVLLQKLERLMQR